VAATGGGPRVLDAHLRTSTAWRLRRQSHRDQRRYDQSVRIWPPSVRKRRPSLRCRRRSTAYVPAAMVKSRSAVPTQGVLPDRACARAGEVGGAGPVISIAISPDGARSPPPASADRWR
jgi:hypothetical protein